MPGKIPAANNHQSGRKPLSVFALVMLNVIAVASLRNVTMGMQYGYAVVFFYLIAAVIFLIPCALVTAELATAWPITGGVYIWIRAAFGEQCGFFAIWLQWIYNVVWYPTIFIFIAGVYGYLYDPGLVNSKIYIVSFTLVVFWAITILNFFGMAVSSIISIVGAVIGTIVPMILMSLLGVIWVMRGLPAQISFTFSAFVPLHFNVETLAFLTNIFFSLMGIEISAVHAADVINPQRDYPYALAVSVLIILLSIILVTLAINLVVPAAELNLVSGVLDAFKVFLQAYNLTYFLPMVGILIIIGSLSGASTWLLSSARGLLIASYASALPKLFILCNNKQVPIGILLIQGVIVTLLSLTFFIMPTVQGEFWWLSNLTAQLALIYYILLFAAVIRLRYKHKQVARSFKIPGGLPGVWLVAALGISACTGAIMLGFVPPKSIITGSMAVWQYELLLITGLVIFCVPPFVWQYYLARQKHS
jgi:amino acid transporter